MKKTIYKCLNFLLFGNVFVAICAVAQAFVSFNFLSLKPDLWVCGFLFFSTLGYYNFCLHVNQPNTKLHLGHNRNNWFFAHRKLNLIITIIAGFAIFPFFFMLNFGPKILVVFLGILAATYNFPLHWLNSKFFNLRNLKGLKLFLIAFVWVLSVVLLPVLQAGTFIPQSEIIILITKQFLLFVAITIPFDVRDYTDDKASNLKTLPIILGVKKAYKFAIILLLVNLALGFGFKSLIFDDKFFASVIPPVLAIFLITKASLRKNKYYYFFYLDGILIVQYLCFLVFEF